MMVLFFPAALIVALSIHIIFSRQMHHALVGFITSTGLIFAYIFAGQGDIPAMFTINALAPAVIVSLVLTILVLGARAVLGAQLLRSATFTEPTS